MFGGRGYINQRRDHWTLGSDIGNGISLAAVRAGARAADSVRVSPSVRPVPSEYVT